MVLKHRHLFPASIFLSSVVGLGGSLAINTKVTKEEEPESLKDKQDQEPNTREQQEIDVAKKSYELNGILMTSDEITIMDVEDSKFSQKAGALISGNGIRIFSKEEQENAQSKFDEYQKKNYAEETWKLLDYDNHQNWRQKTIDLIRTDIQIPKDLLNTAENKEINVNTEEGKEKIASKLREKCYETAGYMTGEEKFKEKFSSEDADEEEIMSFCAFVIKEE